MRAIVGILALATLICGCDISGSAKPSASSDYSGEQASAPAKMPSFKRKHSEGAPSATAKANSAVSGTKLGATK